MECFKGQPVESADTTQLLIKRVIASVLDAKNAQSRLSRVVKSEDGLINAEEILDFFITLINYQ